jgi:hypothetical protein
VGHRGQAQLLLFQGGHFDQISLCSVEIWGQPISINCSCLLALFSADAARREQRRERNTKWVGTTCSGARQLLGHAIAHNPHTFWVALLCAWYCTYIRRTEIKYKLFRLLPPNLIAWVFSSCKRTTMISKNYPFTAVKNLQDMNEFLVCNFSHGNFGKYSIHILILKAPIL